MKIILNKRQGVNENANALYAQAKASRGKTAGVSEAIKQTEKELSELDEKIAREQAAEQQKTPKLKREKKWYEKFRFFHTSAGKLVVAGQDASQNDRLYAQHLADNDLFFHADIQGAPATILQDGKHASEQEKKETAEFAAAYSNAWKNANAAVDVYCLPKSGVSKHSQGGFIPKGGFALSGEREWFKNTPLSIRIGLKNGEPLALPARHQEKMSKEVIILPGGEEKGKTAKHIAKQLGITNQLDEIVRLVPSGKSHFPKEKKRK